jgi:hypothetical protein
MMMIFMEEARPLCVVVSAIKDSSSDRMDGRRCRIALLGPRELSRESRESRGPKAIRQRCGQSDQRRRTDVCAFSP